MLWTNVSKRFTIYHISVKLVSYCEPCRLYTNTHMQCYNNLLLRHYYSTKVYSCRPGQSAFKRERVVLRQVIIIIKLCCQIHTHKVTHVINSLCVIPHVSVYVKLDVPLSLKQPGHVVEVSIGDTLTVCMHVHSSQSGKS